MSGYLSPTETLAHLRREARYAAERARNGLEYLAATKPSSVGLAPRDLVWRRDKVTLWRYRSDRRRYRPPVVLFLGQVSRSYVFDLHPRASFVRALCDGGFDVFLLDWGGADEADADNTLETYADFYFPRALAAVERESGHGGVHLIAYCMGAMIALLYLGSRERTPVRALVTLAAPIEFARMNVLLEPLRDGSLEPDAVIDARGLVPGDVIRRFFAARRPTADAVQYVNLLEKLWDQRDLEAHAAMAQWVRDQPAMPGALFRQVVAGFLRDDAFVNGTARLRGRPVDLRAVSTPILSITADRDDIVPPTSTAALASLVGGDVDEVSVPSGHISLVMGRHAATTTLPATIEWLAARSESTLGSIA